MVIAGIELAETLLHRTRLFVLVFSYSMVRQPSGIEYEKTRTRTRTIEFPDLYQFEAQ